MSIIYPFAGLRPQSNRAADIAGPPYDVLSSSEARQRARGRPWSFLHITKPEIDLPEDIDPYNPEVYNKGAENFQRMQDEGLLIRDKTPCYYLYSMIMGGHTQTGIVAAASVAAYDSNRIHKHEFTRPDKEEDRVRHIDVLNAQTGPVLLSCRQSIELDALLKELSQTAADVDITLEHGVRHVLRVINDRDDINRISECFKYVGDLYIADGHHRSAAASRIASMRQVCNTGQTGEEAHNFFLAVIFPVNQLQIMDYNRVVRDLNGLSPQTFRHAVSKSFLLEDSTLPVKPTGPGEFGMYLDGRWVRLQIKTGLVPADDPVAGLDASLLSEHLLGPVLKIYDLRRDKRIEFVGGIRGLSELERRVDSGEMAVAFSLFPTRMEDVMAVADAGEVMPPKSTWFEPKLADGLVAHILD
ncbi:MAG: DUF1015 domain-containing protein [Mariprofundaceae bacterium]